MKWNGSQWVIGNITDATEFSFLITSFNDNQSSTVEIGTGDWKAIGALTFTAAYQNGPPTSSTVQIQSGVTAWASPLDMGGPNYTGPTVNTEAVPFRGTIGSVVFRLTSATASENDTDNETVNMYNRRHWGVTTQTSGYDSADIGNFDSNELSNSRSKTFTVSPGATEYIVYSYATRLGTATFTVGGFEGGFESPETVSRTNDSGFVENFYVYRSTNLNLGSTTVVVS